MTTHALEELRERLERGDTGLILFPEGARSRDGSLQPFKSGLGRVVAATEVPVVPCAILGAFRAFPPGRRVPRPVRITVRVGQAMTFGSAPKSREGWDAAVVALREAVEGLLEG